MARAGIPRLNHLRYRALERTRRQPGIMNFVNERAETLEMEPAEIWSALKTKRAAILALEEPVPEVIE